MDDCCCLYPGSSVSVALQASLQSSYFERDAFHDVRFLKLLHPSEVLIPAFI